MAGSSPSSILRNRPAVLIVTGAAAACAAWFLYTTVQGFGSAPDSLHRSNAIRRNNRRARNRSRASGTTRAWRGLQQDTSALGHFDFFGQPIEFDARDVVREDYLRDLARQLEPNASPEAVDNLIRELYDAFYHALLERTFPARPLSAAQTDGSRRTIPDQIPNPDGLARAMQRHQSRYARVEAEALLTADGAESIAPTDVSYDSSDNGIDPDGQTLQRTLYHIAEDRARHEGVIHRGITCNGCDAKPIRGIRWRCANCPDYDLCSDCEATNSHVKTHIFYKIRVPAPYMMGLPKQEPVYPGRPYLMTPSVDPVVRKSLGRQTRMEMEEIEALWDQFTCLASTEWSSDPNKIGWAMDRRAFDHAFIPRYSTFTSAPNLVYDRIFAYFDADLNGLIGFEEFIKGLDGLHSSDSRIKLRIAFNGYDIDGDGYISRKDVLRIFRAYYAIEREATRNYLTESADDVSIRGALETIRSAQPLGSAFMQPSYSTDPHEVDYLRGKDPNATELDPISNDIPDTMDREEAVDHALMFRWNRKQFYVDEEEGLTRPTGAEIEKTLTGQLENQTDDEDEAPVASDLERRRESRSSSRVRFQDDVDFDTRSNASTSSRPIGERWGGYEIPEPEKDLGRDVLYQITQQAFNELLDPLFLKKEDAAMEAVETRKERRCHATGIKDLCEEFKAERDINVLVPRMGSSHYSEALLLFFCTDSDVATVLEGAASATRDQITKQIKKEFYRAEHHLSLEYSHFWGEAAKNITSIDMWNAKLCRTQLLHELTETVIKLLHDHINADVASAAGQAEAETALNLDPTMPQFRPNSETERQNEAQQKSNPSGPFYPNPDPFGPFFVAARPEPEPGTTPSPPHTHPSRSLPISTALNDTRNTQAPSSSSSSSQSPPPLEPADPDLATESEKYRHYLSLSLNREKFFCRRVDSLDFCKTFNAWSVPLAIPNILRNHAQANHASHLYLPYLASLETVDREVRHRKGGGLLDFEEFVVSVEEGRLRFLEGWMDLVSF